MPNFSSFVSLEVARLIRSGLLKWLPADEGCPAKSEVLLVGFCTRLYGDNLAISKGNIQLPNTATLIARLSQ